MSEPLTSRVGRIIAGSFHAIVDAVENAAPETIIEQAIREIESTTTEVRADLGTVEAQRHLTAKRLAEESSRHELLADQAALAVEQGREDLARAAIERQIDIEAQIPVLEARMADFAEEKARLEGYVNALLARRREMREALADLRKLTEQKSAGAGTADPVLNSPSTQVRVERATDAFERIFQRQVGLNALAGGTNETAAQLAELEAMSRRNRVQERLAQLKARP